MAKGWKRAAERVVARSGAAELAERLRRPAVAILAYHNIVPEGEDVAGDVSLHVDQRIFGEQLDWLCEGRTVVSLAEAFGSWGDGDRTRVVITFDDAYAGTMTAGLDELGRRGMSGTVFVPPGLLGSDGFWWDRLAPPGGEPLDPRLREHALVELAGRDAAIMTWARAEGIAARELPWHARPIDADWLTTNPPSADVSLGAHTWGHPNLTRISSADRSDELARSKAWLLERTDRYVDWLAYPYGLRDAATTDETSRHFDGALLVSGGSAIVRGRSAGERYRVPRINVPRGMSIDGLALRLAGIGA